MPAVSLSRRRAFVVATVALSVLLSLGVLEFGLRVAGFAPRSRKVPDDRPVFHEPDDVLGWRKKPGRYEMPRYAPEGTETQITIGPDHQRATASEDMSGRRRLAVVGCSYTFGTAVSDDDTYCWKLQERFPSIRVGNYGTEGYGTYQSLLVLERLFSEPDPPKAVIYGFIPRHDERNVADRRWLEALARLASHAPGVPYCTCAGDGTLLRHVPEAYPHLPFDECFVTVALAERAWMRVYAGERSAQKREVTEQLLLEMQRLCKSRKVPFAVAILEANGPPSSRYATFLREHGVRIAECQRKRTRSLSVPGEGHPNGQMHTLWVDDLAPMVAELLN